MFFFVVFGQHSLTSVERPSYLRSDFVNVWRHARLVVYIYPWLILPRSSTLICLMIWRFVSRSCLAFSIIPRLIQPRRCYCIRLEMMFWCFASIKPLSESRRSFQWMLLSNIPWMAPMEWHSRKITQTGKKNSNEPLPHLTTFSTYWRE